MVEMWLKKIEKIELGSANTQKPHSYLQDFQQSVCNQRWENSIHWLDSDLELSIPGLTQAVSNCESEGVFCDIILGQVVVDDPLRCDVHLCEAADWLKAFFDVLNLTYNSEWYCSKILCSNKNFASE